MANIHLIEGKVQDYDWGGTQYIGQLLGKATDGHKMAEYWLGAHVNASAIIKGNNQNIESLLDYINSQPNQVLGEKVFERFQKLPFLFKVLDVEEMLSIQVHPSKIEAEKGFKREEDLRIPLTAPHRNYKDDNHKPEIMVALSDFWLLHGFRPKQELVNLLGNIPEFTFMLDLFELKGYEGLYRKVMLMDQESVNEVLKPLVGRILPLYQKGKLSRSNPDFWVSKSYIRSDDKDNYDRGIFSIYFFNLVNVQEGKAIFQDAGIPHAYLSGQNIELMANSDNVLRAGLTRKHIDVEELLKHVKFEETRPNINNGFEIHDGKETVFNSPAQDFQLSRIVLRPGQKYLHEARAIEIILGLEGSAEIFSRNNEQLISKGKAVCVEAGCEYEMIAGHDSVLYKATVPI